MTIPLKLDYDLSSILNDIDGNLDEIDLRSANKSASSMQREIEREYGFVVDHLSQSISHHKYLDFQLFNRDVDLLVQSVLLNKLIGTPVYHFDFSFYDFLYIDDEFKRIHDVNQQSYFLQLIQKIENSFQANDAYQVVEQELLKEKNSMLDDLFQAVIKLSEKSYIQIDFLTHYHDFLIKHFSNSPEEKKQVANIFPISDILLLHHQYSTDQNISLDLNFDKKEFIKKIHTQLLEKNLAFSMDEYCFGLIPSEHNMFFKLMKHKSIMKKEIDYKNFKSYFIDVNEYFQNTNVSIYQYYHKEDIYQKNNEIYEILKNSLIRNKNNVQYQALLDEIKINLDLDNQSIKSSEEVLKKTKKL